MRVIAVSLLVAAPALVSAVVTPVRRSIPGFATWYFTGTGNAGSCGSYLDDGAFTVAMNSFQYNEGMCGQTITITAKGKSTQAKVMDLCPAGGGNCNYGDVDMSPGLFAFFADPSEGKFPIEWDFEGSAPPTTHDTAPTTTQDATYPVEPVPTYPVEPVPTYPIDSPVVHEDVASVTTPEVVPTVEPTTTEELWTSIVYTEATTESTSTEYTTSTDSVSAAEATTTPSIGEQIALAMKDNNVSGLGAALVELGCMLQNSTGTHH